MLQSKEQRKKYVGQQQLSSDWCCYTKKSSKHHCCLYSTCTDFDLVHLTIKCITARVTPFVWTWTCRRCFSGQSGAWLARHWRCAVHSNTTVVSSCPHMRNAVTCQCHNVLLCRCYDLMCDVICFSLLRVTRMKNCCSTYRESTKIAFVSRSTSHPISPIINTNHRRWFE